MPKASNHAPDGTDRGASKTTAINAVRVSIALLLLLSTFAMVRFAGPAHAAPLSGPSISHTPVPTGRVGEPVDIAAQTTCPASTPCSLYLVYRTTGLAPSQQGPWQRVQMTIGTPATNAAGAQQAPWTAEIPSNYVDSTGVDYYLELLTADDTLTSPQNVLALLGLGTGTGPSHHHVTAVSPPLLRHTPTLFTPASKPLTVTAESTCSVPVCQARLFYKATPNSSLSDEGLVLAIDPAWTTSGVDGWKSMSMTQTASTTSSVFGTDRTYAGQIPAAAITTAGVDYFILSRVK